MKDLHDRLRKELADEESRYVYADSVTNAFLTGQIKDLREERGLTQEKLAELVGTKQSGISRWQNAGYSSCKVDTLRKFAKAFGVRLRISFEEFGTLPTDIGGFSKARLCPRRFEDDPVFKEPTETEVAEKAAHASREAQINALAQLVAMKFGVIGGAGHIKISEEILAQLMPGERAASVMANTILSSIFAKPSDPARTNKALDQTEPSINSGRETAGAPVPKSPIGAPDPHKGFRLVVPKRPPESMSNPLFAEPEEKRA